MQTITELVSAFRQGSMHLRKMAEKIDFPWTPDESDPRKLHNVYARNLISCYTSKFAQLTEALLDALEHERYLIYALSGRSLLEATATLRYYTLFQYKPLMEKGSFSGEDFKKLIEIDDRHLRGGRFDWDAFFFKRYQQLKEDAVKQLKSKKDKQKHISEGIIQEQVNVLTCIEKWAEQTPEVLIAYNLFCDLVHPNIGSSFLVASIGDKGLYFTPTQQTKVGKNIFEQSFPILVSTTLKPFGEYLTYLMATIWQDDELQNTQRYH